MSGKALDRFWRGVREPWDLLGLMRQHGPLWSRYWRTVLVQAGITLVAGLAIFWLFKQGAEAWNDAFGPEEIPESSAPAVAGGAGSSGATAPTRAPGQTPSAQEPATSPTGAADPEKPPAPSAPARKTPAGKAAPAAPPPVPPAPRVPPAPGSPTTARSPAPRSPSEASETTSTAPGDAPGTDTGATGSADDEEPAVDEDTAESDLEAKIKALEKAPPEERSRRTAELVAAAVQRAKKEAGRSERRAGNRKGKDDDSAEELAQDREALSDKLEELTIAAEALAHQTPSGAGEARRARRRLERELDGVEKEGRALERRGAPALNAKDRARLERARAALHVVQRHERGLGGRLGAVLALLAAIYASMGIAQTGVLALTRDFHDALSRELSLLVHVAPEDPPMRPRIRLDLPWVKRKANRRAQFFLGFLPGWALITFVGWLVPPHRVLTTVLTTVWAAYWWMVMTAGQSARAWSPPETTPRPWYLRAWFTLTERVFLLRWARWFGRVWEKFARRFYGPSERVEEQPFEFAGLALSRALMLVPVLKLLFRPIFPVAAAHLLVEHATTARLPVPVTAAEVADAAAHAPDPEARAHSGIAT